MRPMTFARLWGFGLCALLATGCAGSLRPSQPIKDAQLALARRDATTVGLTSMRAEARVDQRAKSGRIRGTVLMFVEESGRVRFDVMTQFGPIAILTSDGAHFAYSDLREKRYLSGETCPENIARLLGVPLSAQETARFLLGGTPVLEQASAKLTQTEDGHYLLSLQAAGARQELELSVYPQDLSQPPAQQRLALVRSELWGERGAHVWRVSYSDLSPLRLNGRELLVPMRVRIEQSSQGSDTLVQFKTIAENPRIPDDAFVQSPRPGMQEEAAPCE
jgi:hypothetical protein